jgi:hypothetical protein
LQKKKLLLRAKTDLMAKKKLGSVNAVIWDVWHKFASWKPKAVAIR